MTIGLEPALVPELLVRDVDASVEFWCTPCGFEIRYQRPEEGFAYITRGTAHVMLEQAGNGRNWLTGPLEVPHSRRRQPTGGKKSGLVLIEAACYCDRTRSVVVARC